MDILIVVLVAATAIGLKINGGRKKEKRTIIKFTDGYGSV
jgi:uncharacterized protein Veg